MKTLEIKSAGAARGLIDATAGRFFGDRREAFHVDFAAVGATFEQVRQGMADGEPCDLTVLTPALAHRLSQAFPHRVSMAGSLGFTPTCLACRGGIEPADISTVDALRRAIGDVEVIFTGDLRQSTIGRHTVHLLKSLGFAGKPAPGVVDFPGGAQAVAALAATGKRALACAQLTEIRLHPSAILVGPLPAEFYLTTEYVLGVIDGSHAAQDYAALLTGAAHEETRRRCGFNPRE